MTECAECQEIKQRTRFALRYQACYHKWERDWQEHAERLVEKRVENVGPHTHTPNTQGPGQCTHFTYQPDCLCCVQYATDSGTDTTQPTQPQGLDTTSRG